MPPDSILVKNAVRNARSPFYRKGHKHWRWVAVRDVFCVGSSSAHELCRRFGLDPDELVSR